MRQKQFLTILIAILIAATATASQPSTGRAAIQDAATAPTANEWDQNDPTAWDWYFNLSATQLTDFMVSRNERLVELEITDNDPLRFSAATVKNAGAYAKASWWYPSLTADEVSQYLATNQARLLDIEAYDSQSGPGEAIRYAVVMIPNTGADEKGWAWYPEATTDFIGERLDEFDARLIDLEAFTVNGQRRYAAIMIGNTGADLRSWGWFINVPWSDINPYLSANRLLDVIYEGNDRYTVVVEGCPCKGWWILFASSEAQVRARAAQLGTRIIDLEHYSVIEGGLPAQRIAVVLMDNLDAESRRIANILAGVPDERDFGLYLKQVGGPVLAALQEDFVHEPLSSIKVTAHLYAMRQVQNGTIGLEDTIPSYASSGLSGEDCFQPDGNQKKLEDVLMDMMRPSSNTDWAATVHYFGKDNIQNMLGNTGMAHTEIRRVGCAALLNRWTLREAGMLYEGVANGSLLSGATRQSFYDIMAGKPGGFNTLVDEEAPTNMSVADKNLFKSLFKISHKDGSWTTSANGEIPNESAFTRVGVAHVPSCLGQFRVTRKYVYGVFLNGPPSSENAINSATHEASIELLRQPIHAALANWRGCQPLQLGDISNLGGSLQSSDDRIHLNFPAGAVTDSVSIFYTKELTPAMSLPPGESLVSGFELDATDQNGEAVNSFSAPFTLVVNYQDKEITAAGGQESQLGLAYFDPRQNQWVRVAATLNSATNQISAQLDHLTEFALIIDKSVSSHMIFLPVVKRP